MPSFIGGVSIKRRVAILLSAWLAVGAAGAGQAEDAAPTPLPPLQFTADCVRPVYATDHLVCADPELRALDDALRDLTRPRDLAISSPYIEPGADWFKRRGLCAFAADHKMCARGAYDERLALLRARSVPPTAMIERIRCPGTAAARLGQIGGAAFLYDDDGHMLAAAFQATAFSAWKPFATYTRKARHISLAFLDGRRMRCEIMPGH